MEIKTKIRSCVFPIRVAPIKTWDLSHGEAFLPGVGTVTLFGVLIIQKQKFLHIRKQMQGMISQHCTYPKPTNQQSQRHALSVTLSEGGQKKAATYYMISFMCNAQNKQIERDKKQMSGC